MYFLFSGFYSFDVIAIPICFLVLLMFFTIRLTRYKSEDIRKLFLRAFYVKMFSTLAYTMVVFLYYGGADTEMYYECTQFLHNAVNDDFSNLSEVYERRAVNVKTPLMNYFVFTDSKYPVFEVMHEPGNFMVPKLALPLSIIFNRSYVCIAMCFSFFCAWWSHKII